MSGYPSWPPLFQFGRLQPATPEPATPQPAPPQPECKVCFSPYDSENQRPLLLPACGHTFCASCVENLYGLGKTWCPMCRKDGAVQPVSSLPVNYSLLDVAQANPSEADAVIEQDPLSPSRTRTSNFPAPRFGSQRRRNVTQINPQLFNTNCLFREFNATHPFTTPVPLQHQEFSIHPLTTPFSVQHQAPSGNLFTQLARQDHTINFMSPNYLPYQTPSTNHLTASTNSQCEVRRAAYTPYVSSTMTVPALSARTLGAHNTAHPVLTALEKEEQDELDFQMAVHLTFCKDSSHDHNLHSNCSSWCWQNP